MPLACRFYANEFPEMEDTVIAKVTKIADMGAYVTLTEYNDKEGMILLSELSRRRIRSVNKLIRVGRSECVVVIRVDEKKGYIDLSKRRVYSRDLLKCEDRFSRAKAINSILCQVASKLGYTENSQLEELYKKTAWHFDEKMGKKAASSEIFKKALTDPTVFDECDISEEIKNKLLDEIKKKLTPQALKIRSDIEVTCFNIEGIEAVKAALLKGKKHSTELMPIEINLIAAPLFIVTTQTMDREEGISVINNALESIKESIEAAGGEFKVVMEPKVPSELDDGKLKERMELLGLEDEARSASESDEEEKSGSESGEETKEKTPVEANDKS